MTRFQAESVDLHRPLKGGSPGDKNHPINAETAGRLLQNNTQTAPPAKQNNKLYAVQQMFADTVPKRLVMETPAPSTMTADNSSNEHLRSVISLHPDPNSVDASTTVRTKSTGRTNGITVSFNPSTYSSCRHLEDEVKSLNGNDVISALSKCPVTGSDQTTARTTTTTLKMAKCCVIIFAGFLAQVILTTCLVAFLMSYNVAGLGAFVREGWNKTSKEQTACVPCPARFGRTNSGEGRMEIIRKSKKEVTCCSDDHVMLRQLFAEFLTESFQNQLQILLDGGLNGRTANGSSDVQSTGVQLSSVQCAAHLFLHHHNEHHDTRENFADYTSLKGWDDLGEGAYSRYCIGYNRTSGQFRVDRSGWYVVYSHLAFVGRTNFDGARSTPDAAIVYSQRIRSGERVLHSDTQGVAANTDPRLIHVPVHSSTVMFGTRLSRDELLTVEAKPADLLHRVNGASYFGLFRLDFD